MQLLHTVRLTLYPSSTPNTLPPSVTKHRTRPSPTATPIRTIVEEEPPHGRPRGSNVDDAIPETHQGKDDAGGVGEGQRNEVRVDKRVDSVDGGGYLERIIKLYTKPMLLNRGKVAF